MTEHYRELAELLLPEGLLEYFDLTAVTKDTNGQAHIELEERNTPPDEYKGQLLHSEGLLPAIKVRDFPLRVKRASCMSNAVAGKSGTPVRLFPGTGNGCN